MNIFFALLNKSNSFRSPHQPSQEVTGMSHIFRFLQWCSFRTLYAHFRQINIWAIGLTHSTKYLPPSSKLALQSNLFSIK